MARVLIADSDPRLLAVAQTALAAYGYEVLVAGDAPLVARHLAHGRAHCLVLGSFGRKLDGPRLLKKVRSRPRYRNLPVCMVCAHAAEMAALLQRHGLAVRVLLAKPFGMQDLVEAVRVLLGEDARRFVHFGRPSRLSLPPGSVKAAGRA